MGINGSRWSPSAARIRRKLVSWLFQQFYTFSLVTSQISVDFTSRSDSCNVSFSFRSSEAISWGRSQQVSLLLGSENCARPCNDLNIIKKAARTNFFCSGDQAEPRQQISYKTLLRSHYENTMLIVNNELKNHLKSTMFPKQFKLVLQYSLRRSLVIRQTLKKGQ